MRAVPDDKSKTTPFSLIWSLTWPQALMMLCHVCIGLVDVWASGKISAAVQASVGLVAQCSFFMLVLAQAYGAAAVAAISQAFGAGRQVRAKRYTALIMLGALFTGLLLWVLGYVLRGGIIWAVRTPPNMVPVMEIFLSAYLASLPAQYIIGTASSVFRAAKMVTMPLLVAFLMCVLNFAGNMTFGLGYLGFPAFGAAGIAWSTFVSMSVSAVLMVFLLRRSGLHTVWWPPLRWSRKAVGYLLRVGLPAAGSSAVWQAGYLTLFALVGALPVGSVAALAGLTAGIRVESLLVMPTVAFNLTASILVGHSLGAGDREGVRRVVGRIMVIGGGSISLVALALWPWTGEIAAWLTPDVAVQQQTVLYLKYNLLSISFTVVGMILIGTLSGAGATMYGLLVFVLTIWGLRLPLAWFLGYASLLGAEGIYIAMMVSQIAQCLILLWIFYKVDWMRFAMRAKGFSLR